MGERLRKGYRIAIRERSGIITDFGSKNGLKTVIFTTDNGELHWGYRSEITQVIKNSVFGINKVSR